MSPPLTVRSKKNCQHLSAALTRVSGYLLPFAFLKSKRFLFFLKCTCVSLWACGSCLRAHLCGARNPLQGTFFSCWCEVQVRDEKREPRQMPSYVNTITVIHMPIYTKMRAWNRGGEETYNKYVVNVFCCSCDRRGKNKVRSIKAIENWEHSARCVFLF